MNAHYEAEKLELLHYLQLNQGSWYRLTAFYTYTLNQIKGASRYRVEKMAKELESEGLVYIKMRSTGWFNRWVICAVDKITMEQYRKLHPRLKFNGIREYNYPCRIWSSKKWFYKPDSPFRYCENCIDYKISVIFGVLSVQKMNTHNQLADIPF